MAAFQRFRSFFGRPGPGRAPERPVCRAAAPSGGGHGITLEHSPLRHANNLGSVRTYEGTDEAHTLVFGQQLTGESAFH